MATTNNTSRSIQLMELITQLEAINHCCALQDELESEYAAWLRKFMIGDVTGSRWALDNMLAMCDVLGIEVES